MKKYWKSLVGVLVTVLLLGACGSGASLGSKLEVEVVSGEFVIPPDKTVRNNKDYVALEIKLKNNSNDTVEFFDADITLKAGDKEIEPLNVWEATETFKTLSSTSVNGGETKTGYLIYEIDKKVDSYTLVAEGFAPSQKDGKLTAETSLSIDKYEDNREQLPSLAKTYITSIFLTPGSTSINSNNSESVSYKPGEAKVVSLNTNKDKETIKKDLSEEIGNDLEEERDAFLETFVKKMNLYGLYYYKPSDEEKLALAQKYIEENSKRADVEYTIVSYLPNVFTVSIHPKVVDLETLDVYSLVDDYVESKGGISFGTDYEAAQKDAEKYVFDHLAEKFSTASVSEPDYIPSGGFQLTFVKEEGKWYMDQKETANYAYENLAQIFAGGLN